MKLKLRLNCWYLNYYCFTMMECNSTISKELKFECIAIFYNKTLLILLFLRTPYFINNGVFALHTLSLFLTLLVGYYFHHQLTRSGNVACSSLPASRGARFKFLISVWFPRVWVRVATFLILRIQPKQI